jgi:hypothetical protein
MSSGCIACPIPLTPGSPSANWWTFIEAMEALQALVAHRVTQRGAEEQAP